MAMYAGAHRHEDMRAALLSEMFTMVWEGEGAQECRALHDRVHEFHRIITCLQVYVLVFVNSLSDRFLLFAQAFLLHVSIV